MVEDFFSSLYGFVNTKIQSWAEAGQVKSHDFLEANSEWKRPLEVSSWKQDQPEVRQVAQAFIHVSLLKPPGVELGQILWATDLVALGLLSSARALLQNSLSQFRMSQCMD